MQFGVFDLLWLFFLFIAFSPMFQQRFLDWQRLRLIRKLESKRNSRVIVLIHRQETVAFLGVPISKYIDIEDSERLLRAIRLTHPYTPIDLILHTPGGLVLASEQIALALVKHKAPVTVFVPHYAMSGGTMIAISANKIVMDENAVLGPLDPQLEGYPAVSIVNVTKQKPLRNVNDHTLILSDMSQKALSEMNHRVVQILIHKGMKKEKAQKLADTLSQGTWNHDFPIPFDEAKKLGLSIESNIPDEIYALMEHYPQSPNKRPSVQFIPVPYQKEPKKEE